MSVTLKDIKLSLERFGFCHGDKIMVHSSLSSFGWVEGGAETVIRALMELLGEDGTILMPSFNHGKPFEDSGAGFYDPYETPCTNGRIPDTFWRIDGVCRSLDPTHPFAAWGKNASTYTKNHHLTLTMGEDSPLGLIMRDDGYQINFGTTHRTTTAKHLAEMINRSPCLGYRTESYPVRLKDGRIVYHRTWGWREKACPLTDSGEYIELEMERTGLQKKGYIGKSLVTYFKIKDLVKVVLMILERGYKEDPPCKYCNIRPRKTKFTLQSDWKESNSIEQLKKEILNS